MIIRYMIANDMKPKDMKSLPRPPHPAFLHQIDNTYIFELKTLLTKIEKQRRKLFLSKG